MGTSNADQTEHCYIEVSRFEAPVEYRLAAEAARKYACRLMGLSPAPDLRWFRLARTDHERLTARLSALRRQTALLAEALDPRHPAIRPTAAYLRAKGLVSSDRILGITYRQEQGSASGGAVWVNAEMRTPRDVAMTVLHELRHAQQVKAKTWPRASELAAAEREAESFAQIHIRAVMAELAEANASR